MAATWTRQHSRSRRRAAPETVIGEPAPVIEQQERVSGLRAFGLLSNAWTWS